MKKALTLLLASALVTTSLTGADAAQNIKAGTRCSKVGDTRKVGDTKFTCVKSGSKTIWKIQPEMPTSVVAPPTVPTGFSDLYEKRKAISYAAWSQVNVSVKTNDSKVGALDIRTGPNTSPYFVKLPVALGLVSRAFPGSSQPNSVVVIRYKYKDLKWAEKEIHSVISQEEYDQLNLNEGGKLLSSNCDDNNLNCNGSKQVTTWSGLALILQGLPNSLANVDPRYTNGMLEAHEYFHSLQRIPLLNKPLGLNGWGFRWITEGSAEWVQNVAINSIDFSSYQNFLRTDCEYSVKSLKQKDVTEFFQSVSDNSNNGKFDQWLNYCLGAYAIEALVAVKGQQSIIDLYSQMATSIGFEAAFVNVYGLEWGKAVDILAKSIFSNLQGI